jgi:tetratricopeptide (TPR) repeat protein
MHRGLVVFVAAMAFTLSAHTAVAQGEMGSIQGTVTDEAGTPLEGATLKLHDPSKGRDFSTKTDKNGKFYKRGIPGSDYQFALEKEGFNAINDKLRVAAGGEHRFDFKLVKGAPAGAKEFALGFDAFAKGDNAGAAAFFEAALVKAPELPEIHVNLAIAYLRLGRKPEAVAQLEEAAKLSPNEPRILFQLGGAYVEMKDWDKATGAFEKGLTKQPDLKDPLAYEATVTLGAVHFAKGQIDESIKYFESALTAKPGGAVPTLGLGKAYLSKGDTDKALQLFQQVMAAAPGSAEAKQAEAFIAGLKKPGSPEAVSQERSSA